MQKLACQGRSDHIRPVSEHQRHNYSAVARQDGPGTLRLCNHEGCGLLGAYRAPQGRDALRSYYWFCLEHIRLYNAAWNFYSGMSEDEVERERRADAIWHRPSWPLGRKQPGEINDPLGLMGKACGRTAGKAATPPPTAADRRALAVLDLEAPASRSEIKQRYKELAKRHHPDTHGGDRRAEEKLKIINQAYGQLMAAYAA